MTPHPHNQPERRTIKGHWNGEPCELDVYMHDPPRIIHGPHAEGDEDWRALYLREIAHARWWKRQAHTCLGIIIALLVTLALIAAHAAGWV